MPQFTLGPLTFPTKGAAHKYVSQWLHSKNPGDTITDPVELEWLYELFKRHPEAKRKLEGVKRIHIGLDNAGRYHSIQLTYEDGRCDDISYRVCMAGKAHSRQDALNAFRVAIIEQVRMYKDGVFDGGVVLCPVSGRLLQNDSKTHIDHDFSQGVTFRRLVDDFLTKKCLTLESITTEDILPTYTTRTHVQHGNQLSDKELMKEWQAYHYEHAKLRALDSRVNMSGDSAYPQAPAL
jgi:hypothetical protein